MFGRIGIMIIFLGAMMGENENLYPAIFTMMLGVTLMLVEAFIQWRSENEK